MKFTPKDFFKIKPKEKKRKRKSGMYIILFMYAVKVKGEEKGRNYILSIKLLYQFITNDN